MNLCSPFLRHSGQPDGKQVENVKRRQKASRPLFQDQYLNLFMVLAPNVSEVVARL